MKWEPSGFYFISRTCWQYGAVVWILHIGAYRWVLCLSRVQLPSALLCVCIFQNHPEYVEIEANKLTLLMMALCGCVVATVHWKCRLVATEDGTVTGLCAARVIEGW